MVIVVREDHPVARLKTISGADKAGAGKALIGKMDPQPNSRQWWYKYSYTVSKLFHLDLSIHWRLSGVGEQERHQ